MLVKVNATLSRPEASASLRGLTAELHDQDPLSATMLARATVTGDDRVEFLFDITKTSDLDSPGELYPDLFVTVRDADGRVCFRSATIKNVCLSDRDAVTGSARSTIDLVFRECPS